MSRVMQCGVEERTIRRQEEVVVECFRYRKKGHKCRKCSLRKEEEKRQGEERAVCVARPQEVQ